MQKHQRLRSRIAGGLIAETAIPGFHRIMLLIGLGRQEVHLVLAGDADDFSDIRQIM
jgi:hypothetical protein